MGDGDSMPLNEGRHRATAFVGAIGRDGDVYASPVEAVFEIVAEEVFRNCGGHWSKRAANTPL